MTYGMDGIDRAPKAQTPPDDELDLPSEEVDTPEAPDDGLGYTPDDDEEGLDVDPSKEKGQ